MLRAVYILCLVLVFKTNVISGARLNRSTANNVGPPLILTPYIENNITLARGFARVNLEGAENIESYSGYLAVDKVHRSNLFFWFFPSKSNIVNDPVILWLQGGEKSSMMFGIFAEHGPFLVTPKNKLKLRDHSWIDRHSVLYIDNSLAGFSYYRDNADINKTKSITDLYNAVDQFYKLFPEFRTNEFYIAGQSYAARYILSLGYTIMKANKENNKIIINLKGMAIGNAMIDPLRQYKYGNYLFQLGLISDTELQCFLRIEKSITTAMSKLDYEDYDKEVLNLKKMFRSKTSNINPLNYMDDKNTMSVLHNSYLSYIKQATVRKVIHVGNVEFRNYLDVFDDIQPIRVDDDDFKFVELLKNYRILFYTGQLDTIVNPARISEFLKRIDPSNCVSYENLYRGQWVVGGKLAGYSKIVENLTELTVRNAGQMVPLDQPEWALDMITRFTRGEKLLW